MSITKALPDGNPDPRAGERLRDEALTRLRDTRPVLLRQLQRAFLKHLLDNGPDVSDAIRALVPIPPGVDPRVVGSAVRALAEAELITSVGRRKSRRPESHARKVDVWQVKEVAAALVWLQRNPEFEPMTDPNDPFAV